MRVDLTEPRNELSLYVRKKHILGDIVVSTSGFEIEFQSKTLRSRGVPGKAVMCEAPVESVGMRSMEGETGHWKVGTVPGDRCCLGVGDGLRRLEDTSWEPSEIC
jgi:hypothetical protein